MCDAPFNDPIGVPDVYRIGSDPVSITLGDFTNSTNLDLIAVQQQTNDVILLMGEKNGIFQKDSYVVGKNPVLHRLR